MSNDKVIEAGRLRVAVSECQDAFFGTYIEESFKNGVNVFDLSGTALMDTILANVRQSIGNDVTKLAWWGDTAEAGAHAACYDPTDGWWKLLNADAVVSAASVAIPNSGAWAVGDGIIALRAMWAAAPAALQAVDGRDKGIYVSRLIYDDYLTSLENLGNAEGYSTLVDGKPRVYFRGVELHPMYSWDTAATQVGAANDVRACYTAKDNLVVGTDTNDPQGEMKMFYDDLTEKVYVRAYFKLGFQFLHDSLVQVGQ